MEDPLYVDDLWLQQQSTTDNHDFSCKSIDDGIIDDVYSPINPKRCADDDDDGDGVLEQKRSRTDFPWESMADEKVTVCEKPHVFNPDVTFGGPICQVNSIQIRLNPNLTDPKEEEEEEEVHIYGFVTLYRSEKPIHDLFKRDYTNRLIFKNPKPDNLLTLPLQGTYDPTAFYGEYREFALVAVLKFNNRFIFELDVRGTGDSPRDAYLVQTCAQVFGIGIDEPFGDGVYGHSFIPDNVPFRRALRPRPILKEIHDVEVVLTPTWHGMLARLQFITSQEFILYGEITARSCQHLEGSTVLFHRTRNDAHKEEPSKFIPLSTCMVAVDCRACLLISVKLWDASTRSHNTLVDKTIRFNVDYCSQMEMFIGPKEAIQVKLTWMYPSRYKHDEGMDMEAWQV